MNGLEVMNLVEDKIHQKDGGEEYFAVQMQEIWSYLFKFCGIGKLQKMTKDEVLDVVDEMKMESPVEFSEWEEEAYHVALRQFRYMVYGVDNEDAAEFENECTTKEMGNDIHFLMASLYIWYHGAGRDAYESSSFKTLAEKYLFHINSIEEAMSVRDELKRKLNQK